LKEETSTEEFRKIQITGKSSFIVSVPKKWVTKLALKPGDQIAVKTFDDYSILLTPKRFMEKAGRKEAQITVSAEDNIQSIIRRIISYYLISYNVIRVKSKEGPLTPLQRASIKDAIRRKLMGAEVVTESSDEVVIQILIGHPELSVQNALMRMFTIASLMHKDAITALKNIDKEIARSIIATDDEVDRFDLYIVRLLKTAIQDSRFMKEAGLKNLRECLGYRLATRSLERVADHSVKIAENILFLEKPINDLVYQKILEYNSSASKLLEDSINALLNENYNMADKLMSRVGEVSALEKSIVEGILKQKFDIKTTSSLRLILESSKRIAECSEDIVEATLNRTVEKTSKM